MTTNKKTNNKSNETITAEQFYGKIRNLREGGSVSCTKFGTVKCTKSAKTSKNGKKMFSVSKSKMAANRGNYTFADICKVFGFSR